MPAMRITALLTALLGLGAPPSLAQTPTTEPAPADRGPVLSAVPTTGAIQLDGRLDEPIWESAPAATGFAQRGPNPGSPATRRTEVRVLFAAAALYVGARLYDHPDSIAAQLARRDASGIYSDWFAVLLDSDDDNRTAFGFAVNPREVERDFILAEDGDEDLSWDAVWEAAARVDSLGWTAELRIPLSQLRYSPTQIAWGINFRREIARREEIAFWAPIPPDAPGYVSRFGALAGLAGLASPTRVELEPYLVSRATRAPGDPANPFYSPNEFSASAGADFRYGITPYLTLTGTVNPDFGQVEADPSVVNLTAFETRFPERRPFFVEGADIFDFELGGGGDLFYSRRIGAPPQGFAPRDAEFREVPERTTILAAAKLSGKTADGWSIGLLDVLTAEEHAPYTTPEGLERRAAVEPLTNFGVARVIRDFRDGRSALGGIFTATNRRLGGDGDLGFLRSSAYAGGIDGRHRFGGGNYELLGYVVGSQVRGSEEAVARVQRQPGRYFQRPDAVHLGVDSALTSLSGLIGNLEVGKIGGGHWRGEAGLRLISPGFEVDDLGFQQRADLVDLYGGAGYEQFRPGPLFRRWNLNAFQRNEWTFGGEGVGNYSMLEGGFQLHSYWGGSASLQRDFAVLSPSALRGGPALRLPGETRVRVTFYSDQRKRVSGIVSGTAAFEDETDGRFFSIAHSLALRPSPRVELALQPSVSWNLDPAQYVGQEEADEETRYLFGRLDQTTAALTARLSYTFTPDLSLQLYAQPFLSAGDYTEFREVADPRATDFDDRFRPVNSGVDPNFNVKQLRSNAVLRWEWRPGSTLFVVWNSGRSDVRPDGSFDLFRDSGRLFGAKGTNVLLVKASYWLGL